MGKKVIWFLGAFIVVFAIYFGFFSKKSFVVTSGPIDITHEEKFGGVWLDISMARFHELGFDFGDSVNILFDTGEKLIDVPFYNGYYVKNGESLVCGYPGYKQPLLTFSNGADIYKTFKLNEGSSKIEAVINKKQKYIKTQNDLDLIYTNDRKDYASDESFANFFVMNIGKLKHNLFYRAASPCDNQYNRATYVSRLAEKAKILCVFDLADNDKELAEYANDTSVDCAYWKYLYENNKVFAMDMSANYTDIDFARKVANGLMKIIENDGPYLIHCTEGKDRTGFVCLLIGALAGATQNELEENYMRTYENYYGITKKSSPDKYMAVRDLRFNEILCFLANTKDIKDITDSKIFRCACDYLKFGGLDAEKIDLLIKRITVD